MLDFLDAEDLAIWSESDEGDLSSDDEDHENRDGPECSGSSHDEESGGESVTDAPVLEGTAEDENDDLDARAATPAAPVPCPNRSLAHEEHALRGPVQMEPSESFQIVPNPADSGGLISPCGSAPTDVAVPQMTPQMSRARSGWEVV